MLIMICRNAYWYRQYFGTREHTSYMHRPKYTEQGDLKNCKAGHMRRWDTIELECSECFVSGLYLYKFISFTIESHNRRGISSRLNGQALKLAPYEIKDIWHHLQVIFGISLELEMAHCPLYCAHWCLEALKIDIGDIKMLAYAANHLCGNFLSQSGRKA